MVQNNSVVYKFTCKNCSESYIGQTIRMLKTRQQEHKNSVKKKDDNSVIYRHCEEMKHSFDFDKPMILDIEKNNFRREFPEILHIFLISPNINKKSDIQFLSHTYKELIESIKNRLIEF